MNLQPFINHIQSAEMRKHLTRDLCTFDLQLEDGQLLNFNFYYEVEYEKSDDPQIREIYYYDTVYHKNDSSDPEYIILAGTTFEDVFSDELLRRHPLNF